MSLKIIPATDKHAWVIAHLGRTAFAETFADLFVGYEAELEDYLDYTFNPEKIRLSLGLDRNRFLLATLENQPVGYAKLKLHSTAPEVGGTSQVQLQKIYVLDQYTGQRVGAALLEACIALAREQCLEWMWLSVVQSNKKAIRFYEKVGFEKAGTHPFTIGSREFHFYRMKCHLLSSQLH